MSNTRLNCALRKYEDTCKKVGGWWRIIQQVAGAAEGPVKAMRRLSQLVSERAEDREVLARERALADNGSLNGFRAYHYGSDHPCAQRGWKPKRVY